MPIQFLLATWLIHNCAWPYMRLDIVMSVYVVRGKLAMSGRTVNKTCTVRKTFIYLFIYCIIFSFLLFHYYHIMRKTFISLSIYLLYYFLIFYCFIIIIIIIFYWLSWPYIDLANLRYVFQFFSLWWFSNGYLYSINNYHFFVHVTLR